MFSQSLWIASPKESKKESSSSWYSSVTRVSENPTNPPFCLGCCPEDQGYFLGYSCLFSGKLPLLGEGIIWIPFWTLAGCFRPSNNFIWTWWIYWLIKLYMQYQKYLISRTRSTTISNKLNRSRWDGACERRKTLPPTIFSTYVAGTNTNSRFTYVDRQIEKAFFSRQWSISRAIKFSANWI